MQPPFDWNTNKNNAVRARHGVGFADVVIALHEGRLLADIAHPAQERYGHQRMIVVKIEDYVYGVPYVFDGKTRFLKTLFPSRKLQKEYGGYGDGEN